MSLVLNGTNQAARFDTNFQIRAFPFGVGLHFKPTAINITRYLMSVSRDDNNTNTLAMEQFNAKGRMNLWGGSEFTTGADNILVAGQWATLQVMFYSTTLRKLFGNGTLQGTGTGTFAFPQALSFVVGALLNASGLSQFGSGKFAHVFTMHRDWTLQNSADLHAGANPLSFAGIHSYNSLASDALDVQGPMNLTLVGAPSFDAADQPAVPAYPSSGVIVVED